MSLRIDRGRVHFSYMRLPIDHHPRRMPPILTLRIINKINAKISRQRLDKRLAELSETISKWKAATAD